MFVNLKSKARFHMLLTYATLCRHFKCTTLEVDQHIKDYAKKEGIAPVIAFQEMMDLSWDIHLKKVIANMADECAEC